ncbi:uncharacterized protein N7483_007311 [Penicillium malachiteum]|uniref:uncharacterized protein n=1 Tax=Penicillium malachiteum TaxID=1324776 RepID=UPI002546F309|nr:uncharacterized protein N7483_007311 [Penicillium malachiteum]KAJ5725954.1 hypothetical protein N7483_007311 [Penicillium malachiteum]
MDPSIHPCINIHSPINIRDSNNNHSITLGHQAPANNSQHSPSPIQLHPNPGDPTQQMALILLFLLADASFLWLSLLLPGQPFTTSNLT